MKTWVYVFKRGFKFYVTVAQNRDEAYSNIQKRMTWSEEIVRKEFKIIHTLESDGSGAVAKLN